MHLKVAIRDYKAANDDAVRLLELDPSNYAGHHAHGYYLCMIGEKAAGLKEIDLAIKLDPEHAARDYAVRASERLAEKKPSEAVADATKALEINPRDRRELHPRQGFHAGQRVEQGDRRPRRSDPALARGSRLLDIAGRGQGAWWM